MSTFRAEVWARRHLAAPAVVFALFVVPLLAGFGISSADTSDLVYVLRRWYLERLGAGELPLLLRGLYMGVFGPAIPVLGLYAPFNIIYLLVNDYAAHQLNLALHGGLAAWGMAAWVKRDTASADAGLVAGIGYGLSGFFVSYLVNAPFFFAAAILPWCLWAATGLAATPSVRRFVALALLLGLVGIEGDPVGMCIGAALCASLVLTPRAVVRVVGATGVALALNAVVLLPLAETLPETDRYGGFTLAQASFYSLHPARLLNLLVPAYWGAPRAGTFWGQGIATAFIVPRFWFDSIYPSLPLLALGGLGLWRSRDRRGLAGVAALLGILALGSFTPLHALLHAHLPVYASLRYPEKMMAFVILVGVFFAGRGLALLLAREAPGVRRLWQLGAAAFAVGGMAAALALALFDPAEVLPAADVQAQAVSGLWNDLVTAGGLALVCLAVGRLAGRASPRRLWSAGVLAVVVLVDLVVHAPELPWRPLSHFDTPAALPLGSSVAAGGRMLRDGLLERDSRPDVSVRSTLAPNWGLLEDVDDAFGYESFIPRRFGRVVGAAALDELPVWARILDLDVILTTAVPPARQLRQWFEAGVVRPKEILRDRNLVILEPTNRAAAATFVGAVHWVADEGAAHAAVIARGAAAEPAILESGEALWEGSTVDSRAVDRARAPLGTSGAATVPIEVSATIVELEAAVDSRELIVDAPRAGVVIVRDRYQPGFRAWVDGAEAPVLRADYLNLGVVVGPGVHRLHVAFAPRSFGRGAVVSLVALGFCAILGLAATIRRFDPSRRGA